VDIRHARYSLAELTEISQLVITKPGVVMVGGNVDGSGITATIDADVNAPRWGVDVPVTLVRGTRPTLTVCSRQDDCSPWWSGAVFKSGIGACTSGFAVLLGGVDHMLSAAHCANLGGGITDGKGSKIGTVSADDDKRDTLLIQHTATTKFSALMYTGPWNADVTNHQFIKGYYGSYIGNFVCTSGADAGWHCSHKILAVWQWVTFDDGTTIGPLVVAERLGGGVANGKGDSGGPVYSPIWYDPVTGLMANIPGVNARGTITGGTPRSPARPAARHRNVSASSSTPTSNRPCSTTEPPSSPIDHPTHRWTRTSGGHSGRASS
jgi:hypothetical protein